MTKKAEFIEAACEYLQEKSTEWWVMTEEHINEFKKAMEERL